MKHCLMTGMAAVCCTMPLYSADYITFADAGVKSLCIANWDADADGELSVGEAAGVKSLGSVFRGQKSIATFDELQYFTGLTAIDDHAFCQSGISHMTLPPTVTSIGEYAFSESSISGALQIPGTVKDIGDYAFYKCSRLTAVVLEEGVKTVGWHSFSGPIATLTLPCSLEFMYSMAVNPYVNADPSAGIFIPEGNLTVTVKSPTPATINEYAFYYVYSDGLLVVPAGSLPAYQAAPAWSHFASYIEMGDVNGDGRLDIADVAALVAYVTGTTPKRFCECAADVNGDGQTDAQDVEQLCQYILTAGHP